MSQRPSTVDTLDETDDTRDPNAMLVSLHYIAATLRRRWRFCVVLALLGVLLAAGFLAMSPPAHEAKTSIVLASPEGTDGEFAMSTAIGMLTTRAVAAQTVSELGLSITPEEFLKTVKPDGVSSELLSITLMAPTGEEAVRRLSTLSSVFLKFRAYQLTRQSTVQIQGMQARIDTLVAEVEDLSQRIDRFSGTRNSSELSDLIEQRASIEDKIGTLQQAIEDATLSSNAVVAASRVIDPAAFKVGGIRRQVALTLFSGLIAGAALGCGIVLFLAVTTNRLRRRSDVANAISHPVAVSVGAIKPLPRALSWVPFLRAQTRYRSAQCSRIARTVVAQLRLKPDSNRFAIGCLGNADEMRYAVIEAATNLAMEGSSVALIDLSHDGCLSTRFLAKLQTPDELTVLRPLGAPELAQEHSDLEVAGRWEGTEETRSQRSDITIIIADIEPIVGADYLAAWTDRMMLAITAGHSSVERLRSVADLMRSAGLYLQAAVLLRSDRLDDSSGLAENWTVGSDASTYSSAMAPEEPRQKAL